MTRAQCRWMAAVVVVAVSSVPAWAQRLSEPSFYSGTTGSGARALGMGGAFIAIADDATAASWNPAGLCVLERAEASVVFQPAANATWKYPEATFVLDSAFQSPTSSSTTHEVELDGAYDLPRNSRSLDFASVTVPLRLGSVKLVPQFSYQRAIDMGLDYEYDAAFNDDIRTEGRNAAGNPTAVTSQQGAGGYGGTGELGGGLDVLAASVGVGFSSKLYLGFSVNRWGKGSTSDTTYGSTYTYAASTTGASVPSNRSGSSSSDSVRRITEDFGGTNFQVGVLVKPGSRLSLGGVYKSGFDMDYDYEFAVITTSVSRSTSQSGTFSPVTSEIRTQTDQVTTRRGTIRWPASFGGGVAVMPKEYLTFSLDATLTRWSKATLTGDDQVTGTTVRTTVNQSGSSAPVTTTTTTPTNRSSALSQPWPIYSPTLQPEQPDGLQVRFGAEYVVRNPGFLKLQVLPIRVGLFRDRQLLRSPQDDTDLYNTGFTTGVGLTWSRLSVDFAFLHARGSRYEGYVTTAESSTTPGTVSRNTQDLSFTEDATFSSSRLFVSSTFRF